MKQNSTKINIMLLYDTFDKGYEPVGIHSQSPNRCFCGKKLSAMFLTFFVVQETMDERQVKSHPTHRHIRHIVRMHGMNNILY